VRQICSSENSKMGEAEFPSDIGIRGCVRPTDRRASSFCARSGFRERSFWAIVGQILETKGVQLEQ
jgi:hypothetical protein